MAAICSVLLIGAATAPSALAQSNPFVPPQAGISRTQIEQIVRQEVERARLQSGKTATPAVPGGTNPATPGTPATKAAVDGTAQQKDGKPIASTASTAPQGDDVVADLLKEGGMFVGCVGGTPVFKDKIGRRAYFTTKELRESNEARRYTRCG